MTAAFEFLLAALPLALMVLLMLGVRWSAARAGSVGLAVALLLSWTVFGFDEVLPVQATAGSLLEAAFTAGFIIWIVFGALCLYYLQVDTGATVTLRRAAFRLARNPATVVLLIAWFFPLFMEGAAGFGTPVALAAPLLVSLGMQPVSAVVLALIGHAAGVSFGAVGTPVLVQSVISGHDPLALARSIAPYHLVGGWVLLGATVSLGLRALEGQRQGFASIVLWTLAAGALFLVPYAAIAMLLGPELPTLGAAALGGTLFGLLLLLARRLRRGNDSAQEAASGRDSDATPAAVGQEGPGILRAMTPYLVLVGLVLATRLVPPLQEFLQGIEWAWALPGGFSGSVQPLYHPGTLLFLAFVIGGSLQGSGWRRQRAAAAQALARLGMVAVALVVMLTLSRIMLHAGMIEAMAATSAEVVGPIWPFLAPGLAALGSFVTGSATSSNILFTDFQQQIGRLLGLQDLAVMGAQGFGGAIGNIVSPHNIIAGSATVGIVGQEGAVLRRTMPVFIACLAVGGVLAFLWAT